MSEIIREFDNCAFETYLFQDADGDKQMRSKIGNKYYGFNVNWVPEGKLEWFAQVYSGNLAELRKDTIRKTIEEGRNLILDFKNFFRF